MKHSIIILLVGMAMAQPEEGEIGTIEEHVIAVSEGGSYNIMGNLSLWGVASSNGDSLLPYYMHRVELGFDMTFDSWLFGFVRLQSWGNEMNYNSLNIPEAYVEAYFADWFSFRGGKQLLTYCNGLTWSDIRRGYPAVSLLFGDNISLNLHGIYTAPAAIGENPSWMAGGIGGAGLGPVYLSVYGLVRPTPLDTVHTDIWAGGELELAHSFFRLSLEGASFSRDTVNAISGVATADLTASAFNIGVGLMELDSAWVNPFGQSPRLYYDERGWGGPGEVYTFTYAADPFLDGAENLSAINAHIGYSHYLDFIRPDLMLNARVDYFRLASALTNDSLLTIGDEIDLALNFSVPKTVNFGLVGGYLMASDSAYKDGYAVRAWIAKDFFFE